MASAPTDIESFRTMLQTLGVGGPTLDMVPDATLSFKDSARQVRHQALHTLPELHFDGDVPSGRAPDLRELGTLGQGGMGVVRLANQLSLDREVAVKTTRAGVSEAATRSLLQEAYVTGYLEHPNIIPIYTVGRNSEGAPLIVMKRIEGTSWHEMLDEERANGTFDLARHIEILIQVSNAVRYAHSRRIIHRDLKPDNVMVGHFGEVYVLDWGIAVSLDEDRPLLPNRTQIQGVSGTPGYMAPEMANQQAQEQDELTDVYLLGATLHHVLTGAPRHMGPTVLAVLFSANQSRPFDYGSEISQELQAIANKACHQDKNRRYPCVEAFRDALAAYLEHRDSIALSDAADQKRIQLVTLFQAPDPDLTAIHDTYGECRFGFYQALRMWPENIAAARGLQQCLETMVDYYVAQENLEGARACLAELLEPRPELVSTVDALAGRLDANVEEFARLKALEKSLDLRMGRRSRYWLVAFLGVVWTGTSFYAAIKHHTEPQLALEILHVNMVAGFRNLIIVLGALTYFRKRIFSNQVNSRLGFLTIWTMVSVAFLRWSGWYLEADPVYVVAMDSAVYVVAIIAMGLIADRRIAWLSLGFAVVGIVGVLWPLTQYFTYAAATAYFFAGLLWMWRPSKLT